MGTIALVLHFFGQLCFGPRQRKFILSRTHHLKDRRPHKQQKSHECRNRIPRQTKYSAPARTAKEKWLTRFYRDAPQISLRADGGQGWFHQISCANGNAAHNDKNVVFETLPQRCFDGRRFIRAMLDCFDSCSAFLE